MPTLPNQALETVLETEAAWARVLAVRGRLLSQIKTALDAAGSEIPYPYHVVVFPNGQDLMPLPQG